MRDRHSVIDLYKFESRILKKKTGKELRTTGRWSWLQKKLYDFLEWQGALVDVFTECREVNRVIIENADFSDRLLDQYEGLFDAHIKPGRVLMGPNVFAKLARENSLRESVLGFSITVPVMYCDPRELERSADPYERYRDPVSRPRGQILDLPIFVIPQMEGVLVLGVNQ